MPEDRIQSDAKALLAAIKSELDRADFFTREDLLHLEVFDHIATISRYHHVGLAVRFLINEGSLTEMNRTDIALPSRSRRYPGGSVPLVDEYNAVIQRHIQAIGPDQLFSVMDIVRRWKSDPHITTNVKRVTVRRALAALARERVIIKNDRHTFYFEGPSA